MSINLSNVKSLEEDLYKYTKEILKYVKLDGLEAGEIKIHINETFGLVNDREDIPRQAFIFYTLSKIFAYNKSLFSKNILDKISLYLKSKYETDTSLDNNAKKYIELYLIRACLFTGEDCKIFLENLTKDTHFIYKSPLLLNLFLSVEADSIMFRNKSILPVEYTDIAKESVNYLLCSEQKNKVLAFNFADIFYYNDILDLSLKGKTKQIFDSKIMIERIEEDKMHTSGLAKIFEGYCNFNFTEDENLRYFYKVIKSRKVHCNKYLENNFHFSEESISEVRGTSYVCIDTYAHLCLGFLNLLNSNTVSKR